MNPLGWSKETLGFNILLAKLFLKFVFINDVYKNDLLLIWNVLDKVCQIAANNKQICSARMNIRGGGVCYFNTRNTHLLEHILNVHLNHEA